MNIHQSKYFSLISLLCGLSVIPTTLTPLIVLNKVNQTKVNKTQNDYATYQAIGQLNQVQDTHLNPKQLVNHSQQDLNYESSSNDLELLMQTLATNANIPKPVGVKQTDLIFKPNNTTPISLIGQEHLNQLDLATLPKSSQSQSSIKQIAARINQLIPPAITACVVSGLIAAGVGVASLIGPASLTTIALNAGAISLEYLICSLVLIGGKKVLENLPPSLDECVQIMLKSIHLESFQKLIDWAKTSLSSCKDLVKFSENCAWFSLIKNALNRFSELLSFNQQPLLKKIPA